MTNRRDEFAPAVEPSRAAAEADNGQPLGRCFAFAGADLLVRSASSGNDRVDVPTWSALREWGVLIVRRQYLGMLNGEPCWSAELSPDPALPAEAALSGLRPLFDQLPELHDAVAGCAVQIVAWERDHQFCGRCGREMARCQMSAADVAQPAI